MRRIKRVIAMFICLVMIIASVPRQVFADAGVGDNNNGGSGGGSVGSNGAYTWDDAQSGFRISVVNKDFKTVSTTVDLLFCEPSSRGVGFGNDFYTNSRASGLSTDTSNYRTIQIQTLKDQGAIKTVPKFPVNCSNGISESTGDDFKEWFLNGKGGLDNIECNLPPPPQPVYAVGYGSTRPVNKSVSTSGSQSTSTDFRPVSQWSIMTSVSYRSSIEEEASSKMLEQGYFSHAFNIILSQSESLKSQRNYSTIIKGKPYNETVSNLLKGEWDYCSSVSKSYAEAVYMYCRIVDIVGGSNWTSSGYSLKNTNNYNAVASNSNAIVKNKISLEQIPLASSNKVSLEQIPLAYSEANAVNILNYADKIKGKFVFQFNAAAISVMEDKIGVNTTKTPLDVMKENNYFVVVEPVFWFRPADWNNGPTNPAPNYFYGTEANLVQYYTNHGITNGGAYTTLTTNLGWSCMYTGKNWTGSGAHPITAVSNYNDKPSLQTLKSYLDSNIGFGMHIYMTAPVAGQQMTGNTDWKIQGAAPDPKDLKASTGYKKEYNIIKYYEDIYPDGKVDYIGPFYRGSNPPEIEVRNEFYHNAVKWFVTNKDFTAAPTEQKYDDAVKAYKNTQSGTTKQIVYVNKKKDGEKTLFVLLQRHISSTPGGGPLILGESEISKAVTTADASVPNWGLKLFPSSYSVVNSATIDPLLEANGAGGAFSSKVVSTAAAGNMQNSEYQTVFWRGNDIPTIASYKEGSSINLRSLLNKYDKNPVGDRGINGHYPINFLAKLGVEGLGIQEITGEVNVNVYRGTRNDKTDGNDTVASEIMTTTPFGGSTSLHSSGAMVQNTSPIQFYPYIRMTYMNTADTVKKDVNVLSQFYSSILANDFGETAWINSNESESLIMSSTQWSLSAKAVNGGKPWCGKNQVIPGGAIFQLSTKASNSKVAVVTWQTILDDNMRNILCSGVPSNDYTLSKAAAEHNATVENAKSTLEELRVVQWVNGDANASNGWDNNGKSIKITDAGQSLSALGLSGVTSSELKYRMGKDKQGDAANQGDLDIVATNNSTDVFYKVIADTSGNIYLAKSIGDIGALSSINGTNPVASGNVTVEKILTKAQAVGSLAGEAKQLNDRTLLITNLLKTLSRNKGNDVTSWAPDSKWYSEAVDGIIVVRKATTLDVGYSMPGIRSAVVDPKTSPVCTGQSDLYSKANLSQFRADSKSETEQAKSKPAHFLTTFEGHDLFLQSMENLYVSKRFYITNVSVSDLH